MPGAARGLLGPAGADPPRLGAAVGPGGRPRAGRVHTQLSQAGEGNFSPRLLV